MVESTRPSKNIIVRVGLVLALCALSAATFLVTGAVMRSLNVHQPNNPLIATPEILRVVARNKEDVTRMISFEIRNRSERPVTIRGVTSGCACVSASDTSELRIPVGGLRRLSFHVTLPKYGVKWTNIRVDHDRSAQPLILQVEAKGGAELPVLREVINASPAFLDLRSPEESDDLIVVTYEEPGSKPWINRLTCDLPMVRIEPAQVEESEPQAGVTERRYAFRVGWQAMPDTPEFLGDIVAITDSMDGIRVPIGRVKGTLHRSGCP